MEAGESIPNGTLTLQLLKSASNEFDVESIHTLSLSKQGLCNISIIGQCIGLERLDLSYNDINQLHPLGTVIGLLTLDLSANRVTSLNGLQSLDKLERLNLSGNLLGSIDVLKSLVNIQSLRHLRLQDTLKDLSNPICMRHSYRNDVVRLLPNLESLDGEILQGPNAHVFSLISEIESEIESKSSPRRDGPIKTATSPPELPDNLFVLSKIIHDEELSAAEQQFRNEVKISESLNNKSALLIAQAEQKLKEREKV